MDYKLGLSPPGIYIHIFPFVCFLSFILGGLPVYPLGHPVGTAGSPLGRLGHPVSPVGMPGVIHRLPPRGTPRGTTPKITKNIPGLLALEGGPPVSLATPKYLILFLLVNLTETQRPRPN